MILGSKFLGQLSLGIGQGTGLHFRRWLSSHHGKQSLNVSMFIPRYPSVNFNGMKRGFPECRKCVTTAKLISGKVSGKSKDE